MKKLVMCILAALTTLIAGCESTRTPPKDDSLKIDRLQTEAKIGSSYIVVIANISYDLESTDEATLTLSLDANVPGRIQLLAEKRIVRGPGKATLSAEIERRSGRTLLAAAATIDRNPRRSGEAPLAYHRITVEYPKTES